MNPLVNYLNPSHPDYDPYLPSVNLPHQQYEAYGIYSIAAITHRLSDGRIEEFTGFVAYQKYDPQPITVDFRELVVRYGNNDFENSGIVRV